jgi:hypothetical protein
VEPQRTPRGRVEILINLLVSDWRPTPKQGLWAIRIGIVLGLLIAIGYSYGITLWEWAKLLIVPAAIAGAGLWFTQQQRARESQVAEQRAETDREIAEERRQDDTLQAYLDGMSQLLTDKDQPLHRAQSGDSLSTVARARTLTVLSRLDSGRKRSVLQFLYESRLIDQVQTRLDESGLLKRQHNIVSLEQADLSKAILRGANLSEADLSKAILSGADLYGGILRWAILRGANLIKATLSGADLYDADLSEAMLSGADLYGALGISNEEVEQQAATFEDRFRSHYGSLPLGPMLDGATMPNGQKYEDWLKDRESRKEDGENDGSP